MTAELPRRVRWDFTEPLLLIFAALVADNVLLGLLLSSTPVLWIAAGFAAAVLSIIGLWIWVDRPSGDTKCAPPTAVGGTK